MRIGRFLAIGAFIVLAGCAPKGLKHAEMQAAMPALKAQEGRIYFYRKATLGGTAIRPAIQLNGITVGSSIPGGFFFVDREAGNYEAHTSTEVERKLTFTLASGETKYIRTFPSFGVLVGRINFELVNAPEAEAELTPLKYTGTTGSQ